MSVCTARQDGGRGVGGTVTGLGQPRLLTVLDGFNIDIDVRNFLIRCQLVPVSHKFRDYKRKSDIHYQEEF